MKITMVGFCLLAMALIQGCAFNSQKVTLNPEIGTTPPQASAAGVSVAVTVLDQRPNQELGRRRAGLYGEAAAITTDQDVEGVVRERVVSGLQNAGFDVISAQTQAPRDLVVEIRLLEYSTSIGFWSGGVDVASALNARATNAGGSFNRFYRASASKRAVFTSTASSNQDLINESLSLVLQKMLGDQALLSFLSN